MTRRRAVAPHAGPCLPQTPHVVPEPGPEPTPAAAPRSGPPPVSRGGARAAEIVAAARRILEEEGPEALTMRRLGDSVSMQAPSLYKHFPSKAALTSAIIDSALFDIGGVLHDAVRRAGPGEPVASLLSAYRDEALGHPDLYRLVTSGSLDRDRLSPGLEEWAGEPFFLATGDSSVAQALWSFAHGMVILELDNRFPPTSDLDRTWEAGVAAFAELRAFAAMSDGRGGATGSHQRGQA